MSTCKQPWYYFCPIDRVIHIIDGNQTTEEIQKKVQEIYKAAKESQTNLPQMVEEKTPWEGMAFDTETEEKGGD